MKVSEFIEVLSKLPQDKEVWYTAGCGCCSGDEPLESSQVGEKVVSKAIMDKETYKYNFVDEEVIYLDT